MKTKGTILMLCFSITIPCLLGGCATSNMTAAQKGAIGGAAVGAIGGQIIGRNTSSTLIGAGVGALGGALLNDGLNKNR